MSLVGEKDSGYFSWKDRPGTEICQSLLTHIEPVDYGMSYLIRLCDGRFLIMDGGWEFEPDADALMNQLQAQSLTEKPVIALWIFTHPHSDHYFCFFPFMEKYGDKRLWLATTKGGHIYADVEFEDGDFILFGREKGSGLYKLCRNCRKAFFLQTDREAPARPPSYRGHFSFEKDRRFFWRVRFGKAFRQKYRRFQSNRSPGSKFRSRS